LLEGRRSLPGHYDETQQWSSRILEQLHAVRQDLSSRRPGYELAVKARMYLILAEVAGGPGWVSRRSGKAVEQHQLERLKHVLTYIETNYSGKIYLRQLAQIAHMSESQFCRYF